MREALPRGRYSRQTNQGRQAGGDAETLPRGRFSHQFNKRRQGMRGLKGAGSETGPLPGPEVVPGKGWGRLVRPGSAEAASGRGEGSVR